MILKEEIKQMICGRGLDTHEAEMVVEAVMEIMKDTEVKDYWDKDISEVIPSSRMEQVRQRVLTENFVRNFQGTPEELQEAVFGTIWACTKEEVRKILYIRMELLAELIVAFK